MQLTTPQLYALAVMAVLTIALIGISYISGLRTGQAAAQRTAQKTREHYVELYEQEKASHRSTLSDLDIAREGHLKALKQTNLARVENENARQSVAAQAQQLAVIRAALDHMDNLVDRLLAKTITSEDLLTLNLAARQLGLAAKAHARSGTNKPNQAELAQQALKEIVARVSAAGPDVPHPDTELLNWLEENATVNFDLEAATLQFLCCPGSEIGVKSTRELLERAMFESEQINAEAAA